MADEKKVPVTFGWNYEKTVGMLELTQDAVKRIEKENGEFDVSFEFRVHRTGKELVSINLSPKPRVSRRADL